MRGVFAGLRELMAPARCAGCDLLWPDGDHTFCAACAPLLEPCPLLTLNGGSAFVFGGPIADAIRRFKYAGRTDHAAVLSRLLAERALPAFAPIDLVVPMPLHVQKLRARGYNPPALLAGPVARALGAELSVGCLVRVRATRDQAGLSRQARSHNVRGAFALARKEPPARILLIDDVRTTGATLAAAAETLARSGHEVMTFALAQADEHAG